MSKVKKRPSKRKKAVLKVLEESKDLETAKAVIHSRIDKNLSPANVGIEAGVAHKSRPDKKRG